MKKLTKLAATAAVTLGLFSASSYALVIDQVTSHKLYHACGTMADYMGDELRNILDQETAAILFSNEISTDSGVTLETHSYFASGARSTDGTGVVTLTLEAAANLPIPMAPLDGQAIIATPTFVADDNSVEWDVNVSALDQRCINFTRNGVFR